MTEPIPAEALKAGKRYLICLDGFDSHERIATTAAKARYADFKAAKDAGYFTGRHGFRDYLARVYTLHLGAST